MKTLLADTAVKHSAIVWAALVVFTLISFVLGGEHVVDARTFAAVIVIGIGAVKIRLVGLHFMELSSAPLPLRAIFEGYCVVLCCALMGICAFA